MTFDPATAAPVWEVPPKVILFPVFELVKTLLPTIPELKLSTFKYVRSKATALEPGPNKKPSNHG